MTDTIETDRGIVYDVNYWQPDEQDVRSWRADVFECFEEDGNVSPPDLCIGTVHDLLSLPGADLDDLDVFDPDGWALFLIDAATPEWVIPAIEELIEKHEARESTKKRHDEWLNGGTE